MSSPAAMTSGWRINVDDFNWTTKLHQTLDLHLTIVLQAPLPPNFGTIIPLSGLTSKISLDLLEFWIDQKGDQLAYICMAIVLQTSISLPKLCAYMVRADSGEPK